LEVLGRKGAAEARVCKGDPTDGHGGFHDEDNPCNEEERIGAVIIVARSGILLGLIEDDNSLTTVGVKLIALIGGGYMVS
jgi:hypothetical protein